MSTDKVTVWERHRFKANLEDSRPVKFPPPGPWWETGFGDDYSIVVAYLPYGEPVTNWWPEARDIESEITNEILYTSRFPKPDWYKETSMKPANDSNPWDAPTYRISSFDDVIEKHRSNLAPLGEGHKDLPPPPTGDPRFHALLKQLGELHDKKQMDYGRDLDPFANVRASQDFGVPPWVGCMIRANDKMRRLQTYAGKQVLACESVEDSFLDLAVYSLIGLILFRESTERIPPSPDR